jgi:hypothetical protein
MNWDAIGAIAESGHLIAKLLRGSSSFDADVRGCRRKLLDIDIIGTIIAGDRSWRNAN